MFVNGTLIDNRFEVLDTIGVGGFGTVVKARQIQFDRLVAVKLLKTTLEDDPDARPRFEREAKAINALKHKNIVSFYGYGVWHRAPYMVMELVGGESLEQIIAEGKLEPGRALKIIAQVFEALDFAHRQGVVHRDLKPSNIMVVNDGNGSEVVKIIDFGLAKLMPSYGASGQKLTETGYAVGTCHYMPPEQALGIPIDQRADIYSAGCILQHALTGEFPFDAPDNVAIMFQHLNDPSPPLNEKLGNSKQTSALQSLIDNCIAKDPADRYMDGTDAAREALLVANGNYDSIPRHNGKTRTFGKSPKSGTTKSITNALIFTALVTTGLFFVYYAWLGARGSYLKPTSGTSSSHLAEQLNQKLNLATKRMVQQRTANANITLETAILAAKTQSDPVVREAITWSRGSELIEMYINQNKLGEASKVGNWLKGELGKSELYEFPCLISLGNIELSRKNYACAEKYFRGALKARGSVGAWGWLGLARSELYQEHFALAGKYANRSLAANSMKKIEDNDTSFHPEYLYPILTTAAATQNRRASIESLIEEHSDSVLFGAPLSPASLNGLDMSIAFTELRKAGLDDLVPRLRRPTRQTLGLYNPISAQ